MPELSKDCGFHKKNVPGFRFPQANIYRIPNSDPFTWKGGGVGEGKTKHNWHFSNRDFIAKKIHLTRVIVNRNGIKFEQGEIYVSDHVPTLFFNFPI